MDTINGAEERARFIERWGSTPEGRKVISCQNCGRCVDHAKACHPDLRQLARKCETGYAVLTEDGNFEVHTNVQLPATVDHVVLKGQV